MIGLALLLAAATAMDAYRTANALFQQKRFPEAIAAVDEALRLDSALVPALTLKAKLAMAFNRLAVARECLLRASQVQPDSAYVQFLLGFELYLENDFARAVAPLETARRLDPKDPRAVFYLAMTHEGLGQADEALGLYAEAVELETKQGKLQPDTLIAYARLLFTLGRYGESEKLVDRTLRLAPGSRDGHYEKGRLLFERGEVAGAIEHGEAALAASGVGTTDRQIHFLLGRAYLKAGQNERAEEHLAKFRASAPSLRR
jgi:tetratricopeptide (TPR) repeat protein